MYHMYHILYRKMSCWPGHSSFFFFFLVLDAVLVACCMHVHSQATVVLPTERVSIIFPAHLTTRFCSYLCWYFACRVGQMAVLKKHHRAAHHGLYYECLVKFKGVAYNKVYIYIYDTKTVYTDITRFFIYLLHRPAGL